MKKSVCLARINILAHEKENEMLDMHASNDPEDETLRSMQKKAGTKQKAGKKQGKAG
jgi:hypothetical protein